MTKRMTRYPAAPDAAAWTGPVIVRGWLRVRRPLAHPLAVLTLARKWTSVVRATRAAPGYRFFEYWQRMDQLVLGMHVGWSNQTELNAFDTHPAHRDISRWASRSSLVIAMKLETYADHGDGRLERLSGFHIAASDEDLPTDLLFGAAALVKAPQA